MSQGGRWALPLLLLASLASLWLYFYSDRLAPLRADSAAHPELAIVQPHWLQFDARGEIERRLQAERLEHWAGEDGARLTRPRLRLRDSRQRGWLAQALSGHIDSEDNSLLLQQQVILHREQAPRGPVIKTGYLRIAQRGDRIETDDAVVLDAGSWHFTANGLRTDLGRQRLELLGGVRGIHE